MNNLYAVIIAGGRGERFWPKSRLKTPKHLLSVVGDKPMLVQTIERLGDLLPLDHIFIITSNEQQEAVRQCCPQLNLENIVPEPVGRDTAAVVGLATVIIKQKDPNGVFAILPADHVVHNVNEFQRTLKYAYDLANSESVLVTLGIKPTFPATGYGYLKKGNLHSNFNGNIIYNVDKFVEKPDLTTAHKYLKSGEYFWNSGMFVWSVNAIDSALKAYTPNLYKSLEIIAKRYSESDTLPDILNEVYHEIERISIDYAVMEKVDNMVTIESMFDWDDVGAWSALERHLEPDSQGNIKKGEVIVLEGNKNIVVGDNENLTVLIGVDDLIVVKTDDVTLVCHKNKSDKIKELVKKISENRKYSNLL